MRFEKTNVIFIIYRDIHHQRHLIVGMEELLLYQQLELLILVIHIVMERHHLRVSTNILCILNFFFFISIMRGSARAGAFSFYRSFIFINELCCNFFKLVMHACFCAYSHVHLFFLLLLLLIYT